MTRRVATSIQGDHRDSQARQVQQPRRTLQV